MNADIWFSVGVTVASLAAVAVAAHLFPIVRRIPRGRVEVLVKTLSAGCFQRADKTSDDWGYRLQSFGDLACAFSDAMNRRSAPQSPAQSMSRGVCNKRRMA